MKEQGILFRSYVNFVWFCWALATKGQLSFELATPSLSLSLSQTSPMNKRKYIMTNIPLKNLIDLWHHLDGLPSYIRNRDYCSVNNVFLILVLSYTLMMIEDFLIVKKCQKFIRLLLNANMSWDSK